MGYERYPRENQRFDQDNYGGQDTGGDQEYRYSSARDYAAAGRLGNDRNDDRSREHYGARDRDGQPQHVPQQFDRGAYGERGRYNDRGNGTRDAGGQYGGSQGFYGQGRNDRGSSEYHGAYAANRRRFLDVGRYRHADDDDYRGQQRGGGAGREPMRDHGRAQGDQRDYGRQPQGYDYEERGFLARAGDEVRSWFGDDEAERRREFDSRYDDRADRSRDGGRSRHHDDDYHGWRSSQIAALDRDYDEYRRENRTKFETEFSTWRTTRQGQRDQLSRVIEHQDVVGSDGAHVGTVDKVRGDRILLTKNDTDAGGRHHSIPSNWVQSVDDKVVLNRSADDAKAAWRDEERNRAMFGDDDNSRANAGQGIGSQRQAETGQGGGDQADRTKGDGDDFKSDGNLNRSFPGTY